MSVSDLSGTKWLFNDTLDLSNFPSGTAVWFYIGFEIINISNNKLRDSLQVSQTGISFYKGSSGLSVYNNNAWTSPSYKTIYIIGGIDTVSTTLINWIESNATQLEVDLSEEYLTNKYDLTQVGNAIRKVTKICDYLSYPTDMVSALNNMGQVYTLDDICNRGISGSIGGSQSIIGYYAFISCSALTTASFPNCTIISSYAFEFCSSLTTASFPNCTSIGDSAFYRCRSLATILFSNCVSIGMNAFQYCSSLRIASFPNCTTINPYAFVSCSSLTTISFPNCTSIGNYAFSSCSALTTASFPNCTYIGASAFQNCSALTTVSFPSCTSIGGYTFRNCTSLTTVSFPSCTSIGSYAFYNCTSLTIASFPKCTYISGYAFYSCFNLISLNLTSVSVVTSLPYSSAFSSTPIAGYSASAGQYGSIYVPASLYDAFISATNWTYFSSRMVSV